MHSIYKKRLSFISLIFLFLTGCDFLVSMNSMSEEECEAIRTSNDITKIFENGNLATLEILVECGLDVNEPIQNGILPLFAASYGGHLEMVEFLLSEGAEVDAGYNSGYEIIDERNGGSTALIATIMRDQDEVARLLLRHGADMAARLSSIKYKASTLAATEGSVDMLSYFLENGADPMEPMRVGSLIDFISKMGKEESVALLLKNEKVANSRHGSIHKAAQEGHLATVKALISVGDDLDSNPTFLGSGLLGASNTNKQDVMELLIAKGADINDHYVNGNTSLMSASKRGHVGAVKILLSHGADKNLKDENGNTALMLAEENGYKEVVSLLSKP